MGYKNYYIDDFDIAECRKMVHKAESKKGQYLGVSFLQVLDHKNELAEFMPRWLGLVDINFANREVEIA